MHNMQTDLFRHTDAGLEQAGGPYTLKQAIEQSVESLKFAESFDTWLIGYSGGKDSTALVSLIDHLISTGKVKRPKHLILNNNDTMMELPPLAIAVDQFMKDMQRRGWICHKTKPQLQYPGKNGTFQSGRFMVVLLGMGYAPPNSGFTWCRQRMKLTPLKQLHQSLMVSLLDSPESQFFANFLIQEIESSDSIKAKIRLTQQLNELLDPVNQGIVTIDGVRIGESAVRDKAIKSSCSVNDDGECGSTLVREVATGLKLSPVAHWRVCHVMDWLIEAELEHGYKTLPVLDIYGATISDGVEDLSARTGCYGCPLVTAQAGSTPRPDKALLRILKLSQWSHLKPLLELGDIYWRLRMDRTNRHVWNANKKGKMANRHGRPGCLTLAARQSALAQILDIQRRVNAEALRLGRSTITIIPDEELELIHKLWAKEYMPTDWSPDDPTGADWIEPLISQGQLEISGLRDLMSPLQ